MSNKCTACEGTGYRSAAKDSGTLNAPAQMVQIGMSVCLACGGTGHTQENSSLSKMVAVLMASKNQTTLGQKEEPSDTDEVVKLKSTIADQLNTIKALNMVIGGEDSTTTENIRLVDRLREELKLKTEEAENLKKSNLDLITVSKRYIELSERLSKSDKCNEAYDSLKQKIVEIESKK